MIACLHRCKPGSPKDLELENGQHQPVCVDMNTYLYTDMYSKVCSQYFHVHACVRMCRFKGPLMQTALLTMLAGTFRLLWLIALLWCSSMLCSPTLCNADGCLRTTMQSTAILVFSCRRCPVHQFHQRCDDRQFTSLIFFVVVASTLPCRSDALC